MSHTVELPETLYRALAARARRKGQAPEELLLALVEDAMRRNSAEPALPSAEVAPSDDPIAPFIGAFAFGAGDRAEKHDYYLSQSHDGDHAGSE